MLALLMAAGCARSKKQVEAQHAPAPPPESVVLDYGNGWYHTATGSEKICDIAAHYQRSGALVAELNHTSAEATPARDAMIYIPPVNNRTQLKPVLARIRNQPESIPRKPWNPMTKVADPEVKVKPAVKQADPWIANKRKYPGIVEDGDKALRAKAVAPAKPQNALRGSTSTKPPAVKPAMENKSWPTAEGNTDEPKLQVASLTGEASLPSRAAQAGEAMLNEISDKMTQTRQHLSATKNAAAPAGESTETAGRGKGECAWPLQGTVVTKFDSGWRNACHGIEITAPVGTPVRAARAGRVLMAQEFITYGKLIVVDHGDGFATAYGYNSNLRVKANDRVEAGQIIGQSGTAPRYGPHGKLFFQVRRDGIPVDPLAYLK